MSGTGARKQRKWEKAVSEVGQENTASDVEHENAASDVERESMEFDVVIVGAGPAGLAAAIRLKQRDENLSIVVLEKGSEVGAHILSGAVMDPSGLEALLPDWRDDPDCPVQTEVTADHFLVLGHSGSVRLPNVLMPPLMNNHGNYIISLGDVCRWLGTRAEALGVEIYPGFAAANLVYGENDEVRGVITGDMGVTREGEEGANFMPGMELLGKYTLIGEGVRGSLAKQLIDKFDLSQDRDPQKFGIGLKEVWEIKPENFKKGLVQHSFGWPLDMNTGGGSFLYHFDDNKVSVGFVIHLNYENPYLSPFQEFQRFKTHPAVAPVFEGAKRLSYGARAITEGGWQSVPKLSFPGGALIGCSAGFVNVPRIKGIHNAMQSGMLAANAIADALADGRANDELTAVERKLACGTDRQGPQACPQRQAVVEPFRHAARRRPRRPRHVAQPVVRHLALRHARPWQDRRAGAREGEGLQADRLSEARRHAHFRSPLLGLPVQHQSRGGPAGSPRGQGYEPAGAQRIARICRPLDPLLPGRCL